MALIGRVSLVAERRDYERFYKELDKKKLDFNEALALFANEVIPGRVNMIVRDAALEIVKRVTAKTPKDTGRAQANWNVGINRADLSVTDDVNRDPAAEAEKVLSELKPYQSAVVSNNLEYIGSLERGHSGQAPAGMLGLTLDEMKADYQQR
jgi:hypothetical protein